MIMSKEDMYLVRKVDHNGATHAYFTLDLDGVMLLLRMVTPGLCKFEIEKIDYTYKK